MIFEEISKANIQAMKDRDKVARSIFSVVLGKLKQASIDSGLGAKELPDPECVRIISKTIKELEEEQLGYQKVNRLEEVETIEIQKNLLKKYLPKMLSEEEIRAEIEKLDDKKIPNVMKHFKANFSGTVDMGLVSKIAKEYN